MRSAMRLAFATHKDGKVALAKGYGVRKLGETVKVDEHTVFGIGSNTKAFTTAARSAQQAAIWIRGGLGYAGGRR